MGNRTGSVNHQGQLWTERETGQQQREFRDRGSKPCSMKCRMPWEPGYPSAAKGTLAVISRLSAQSGLALQQQTFHNGSTPDQREVLCTDDWRSSSIARSSDSSPFGFTAYRCRQIRSHSVRYIRAEIMTPFNWPGWVAQATRCLCPKGERVH